MVKHSLKKYRIGVILALLGSIWMIGCSGAQVNNETASATASDTPAKRGEAVVAEYLRRDSTPYRKIRVRFTISVEGDPDKVYELDIWRKQTPEATTTMSQIIRPLEDSDLGSLTLEQKGQKTVVVSYAEALGEFRETDTKKIFFGGLTAGELLGEWDKFTYKQTGEKERDGQKVVEIEGRLKPDTVSIATRLLILFRTDNYVPVEVHLFDSTDREIRTARVLEIKGDADHAYASRTEVENPIYKARIIIEILSRETPANIDDSMFSREKLKQFVRK